ncbi:hypothetical protein [Parachitinimonas caeni]|uniref:DUF304 domain-containing protein n=1 Tax=Parachitinimonas caeni TaxID=3031301 RepID=A0ABT7E020_9NEIS|nr:hypothetical protein [Parachitinimonas caeni]MDK2124257.1 hypothetical protein [Parachitinimonas caeni]
MQQFVPHSNAPTFAQLARWVRVLEGPGSDSIELASTWQRLPEHSLNRLFPGLVVLVVSVLAMGFLIQAAIIGEPVTAVVGGLMLVGLVGFAWHKRYWFWRTIVHVSSDSVSLSWQGWGVPATVSMPLTAVSSLEYALEGDQLQRLELRSKELDAALQLPISGQRDLDRLYYNLLKHLLTKHSHAISFGVAP